MARFKDVEWSVEADRSNRVSWDQVQASILMDIRDELKQLNRIFSCPNFLAMPRDLRAIRLNTTKRKAKT